MTTPLVLADWQPFGGAHVDWGNFPAWFGAIITSLSVSAALYVILRDRIKSIRRTASLLHADPIPEAGPLDKRRMIVNLYNASKSPIIQPYLTATPSKELRARAERGTGVAYLPLRDKEKLRLGESAIFEWWIEPEDYGQIVLPLPDGDDHDDYSWEIHFRCEGRKWVLDLDYQKLRLEGPRKHQRAKQPFAIRDRIKS